MSEYGEIIAAIISTVYTIVAAFVAVLFAGKIVKDRTNKSRLDQISTRLGIR